MENRTRARVLSCQVLVRARDGCDGFVFADDRFPPLRRLSDRFRQPASSEFLAKPALTRQASGDLALGSVRLRFQQLLAQIGAAALLLEERKPRLGCPRTRLREDFLAACVRNLPARGSDLVDLSVRVIDGLARGGQLRADERPAIPQIGELLARLGSPFLGRTGEACSLRRRDLELGEGKAAPRSPIRPRLRARTHAERARRAQWASPAALLPAALLPPGRLRRPGAVAAPPASDPARRHGSPGREQHQR